MSYESIWNEFRNKWNFAASPLSAVQFNAISFVRCNGTMYLDIYKQDRRMRTGGKFVTIYQTTNANEMREYLVNNSPLKNRTL